MEKLGEFVKRIAPKKVEKVTELVYQLENIRDNYTDQVFNIIQGDITTLDAYHDYDWLLWILSLENEELLTIAKEIREQILEAKR